MQLRTTDEFCIRAAQLTLPLRGSMLVYPLTCVELARIHGEARSQHSTERQHKMLGGSSLAKMADGAPEEWPHQHHF